MNNNNNIYMSGILRPALVATAVAVPLPLLPLLLLSSTCSEK